ncbi:alpha/beta fold hydrolase, partial [Immundisolibacter sp.]|uniref:alpha/beta fold hydrolase n=1 Tax=Immundisolibacter sp. TaxID=1934948 RepID=UPI00260E2C58
MHERRIDLTCGQSRYLEAGDGPPVLLLHGMGMASSANGFDLLIAHLAGQFRVLAPDLLGFGLGTRRVEAGPTFELIVEQLREFMDRLGLARVHVVGHSLGGWVGNLLAYESPQRVARLVALCSAGLNVQPAAGIRATAIPSRGQIEALLRGWLHEPARVADADFARLVDGFAAAANAPGALESLDPLLAQQENPTLRARYLLMRRLPLVTAPTLIIWGEHDPLEPYPVWKDEAPRLAGDMRRSSRP